jgi:hypothetical protein
MKNYTRRQDYSDLPREAQIGILRTELDLAETDEERTNAQAAIKRMEEVIERFKPRQAPEGGMSKHPEHDLYQM